MGHEENNHEYKPQQNEMRIVNLYNKKSLYTQSLMLEIWSIVFSPKTLKNPSFSSFLLWFFIPY